MGPIVTFDRFAGFDSGVVCPHCGAPVWEVWEIKAPRARTTECGGIGEGICEGKRVADDVAFALAAEKAWKPSTLPRDAREWREGVCIVANRIGRTSRLSGAPTLSPESSPETIARWLQWCDPNGCHTAARAIAEGFDAYTEERAWEALSDMVWENAAEEPR